MSFFRLFLRLFFGKRLPLTAGELRVPTLRGEVKIHRDNWGVPHVEATCDWDAWFALGFCHAQDRAFQLEIILRLVRGGLAEMVGEAALPVDRLSRRIGFRRAALKQVSALAPEIREQIDAYCCGITTGATQGLPRRPHELALLRTTFTPWTIADVLGWFKAQSFLLAANWDVELARWKIATLDGAQAVADLTSVSPEWLPTITPMGKAAGPALDRLFEELAAFAPWQGLGGGSNNWALQPSRTATGRPILANDPHLSAALPAHWYLAHVKTPTWEAAGGTFVGLPAFPSGHNGFAAWGVTAGLADNTDLFHEQLTPDGKGVVEGGKAVPCEVVPEEIAVKRGQPVVEEVHITSRGPIISPALDGVEAAMSLRATWLEPKPVVGLLGVHRARSFDDFRKALSQWPCGTMNMTYADVNGVVGWQFAGDVPRRRGGFGLFPGDGTDRKTHWHDESLPFEDLPYLICAHNGTPDFAATSNNQPRPASEGAFLGVDWMDGYRQAAIVEALSGRSDWDVAKTQQLQTDLRSMAWRDLREAVLAVPSGDPLARQGLEVLRSWDGILGADSAGAAVYEFFVVEMIQRVAKARAPRSWEWAIGQGFSAVAPFNFFGHRRVGHLARLVKRQPVGWFERSWPEEMADALSTAVEHLRSRAGNDPRQWAWGRLRPLTMHHPLAQKKMLAKVFNLGPVPCGGDNDTIAQASVMPLDLLAHADNIPSVRVVVDVGNWGASRYCLPGGQSGNPFSQHYGDQFPLWQRGEGIPIPWTADEVRAATRETLTLRPLT